jgi:3-phenylpropionate/trans-cinnamate dioxygenase ferredoxin component
MTEKKIGSVKEFVYAPLKGVEANGKEILIVKKRGKFAAIGNKCTHMGCKLSSGKSEGETVRCPCHGSVFNVITGEVVHGPATRPEPVYSIREENEGLFLDV